MSDAVVVTEKEKFTMNKNVSPHNRPHLFFVIGLMLIFTTIICNQSIMEKSLGLFGIGLNLGGAEGIARVWTLKIVFFVLGLPLLLYKYRLNTHLKLFFDLSVGLIITLVLLLGLEGFFYILNLPQPSSGGQKSSVQFSEPYVELDEFLGYQLKVDLKVEVVQTVADEVIYKLTYAMDENRRRVTPLEQTEARANFILFFGGSFTFGDGVANNETLPAYVGHFALEHRPYNYGVPGYGTQQMLAKLQRDDLSEEIQDGSGIAIYTFICPHVGRVIGTSQVHNTWGKSMPYYTLDFNDKLIRQGDFVSGRPILSLLYPALSVSQTAKYFNITLPRINDSHYQLTARVIEESANILKEELKVDDFYVLFYPRATCSSLLIPHLDAANIKYLDYSTLFTDHEKDFWQPDGHPTAKAYKIIAEKLTVDLDISDSKETDEPVTK